MNEEKGPRLKVLYNEAPVMFPPSLAILVGVDAAIIIQKIEFLCEGQNSGREMDGERWIWNTYEQWRDDHFPWWSAKAIKDKIRFLEKIGYILSCQPDGRMSRKKYYRVSTAFKTMAHKERAKEVLEERNAQEGQTPDGTKMSNGRTLLSNGETKMSLPKHRRPIIVDPSKEDPVFSNGVKLKGRLEDDRKKGVNIFAKDYKP